MSPTSRRLLSTLCLLPLCSALAGAAGPANDPPSARWEEGFREPPASTRPWCYWYWISDNISREGITRDLEAMARVGIGEAFIGNIFLEDIPAGPVKVLSEEWWGLVEHAIREGGRTGVDIGMFNCPGWSQSGGPWIGPERSMRHLTSSELRVRGPTRIERELELPADFFQDVAVLAFPAPRGEGASLAGRGARLDCDPEVAGAGRLIDGDPKASVALVAAGSGKAVGALTIDVAFDAPITARSLSLLPGPTEWSARCELLAGEDGENLAAVETFVLDRSNRKVHVGFLPDAPVTVSFPPVTARRFRLRLRDVRGAASLRELEVSPAARVEAWAEKQLAKMHPTPQPRWDSYLWPDPVEVDAPDLAVARSAVVDLSRKMDLDGTLRWDVPVGEWIVLRVGMAPTGTRNSPASPEGSGLEVDKMSREALRHHFDAFIGRLLDRMPPSDRRALRHVVADSYEMGAQNWSDGFGETFRARYGYDPRPWLPALTGRVVSSAEETDRFLWDLRRLVADRIARDYVGGLRDLCQERGLELWLENYGHWGFPAEFLQYGGQSHRLGGEFWVTGSLGSIECRAASSAAATYGFPIVSAEAFTGGPLFQTAPSGLKARGDWAFCQGVNHLVLHVDIHQPWDDRRPGMNAWFGTEFNRHNTWFEDSRAWIDYLRRTCFLLQQGTRVADVAYFIGEDAPKMSGRRVPELPAGRDFDDINEEVIRERLRVEDGRLALPDGGGYRVLVLPDLPTMRPALLRRIRDLVREGATVLGRPPSRSPSLEGYPGCDEEVRRLAVELWGSLSVGESGERRCGRGRVFWGTSLEEHFAATDLPPDFSSRPPLLWTHRSTGREDIYFVSHQEPEEVVATVSCRVGDRAPELWRLDSGRIERPAVYDVVDGVVRLPLLLGPHGSVAIVFRGAPAARDRVVAVERDGEPIVDLTSGAAEPPETGAAGGDVTDDFTLAVWVRPAAETALPEETDRGASGLGAARNDLLFPPHGVALGGPSHAGCGLAAGTNGVAVFEHSASYFAPLLVHPAGLAGWTHLALVYRSGQPSLYLDGRLARRGLRSRYTVHLPVASGGGGAPFRGRHGVVRRIGRALEAAEVAELAASMPRPGMRPPLAALELTRGADGSLEAGAWRPGDYRILRADGSSSRLEVAAVGAARPVDGPWDVRFDSRRGGRERVRFEELVSWIDRPEASIRHHSGRATYRVEIDVPESWAGGLVELDLGEVRDLAVVRVDGRSLGTLWMAPWRLDISRLATPGRHRLEVDVVNVWNNRLVGDRELEDAERQTWLARMTLGAGAPLLPAGLLGPVRLVAGRRLRVD